MPKISIIVPVYNMEKYIARCIRTLTRQTLTDIEILLIDDGSTDNSLQIMQEFADHDNRIKILQQKNLGPAAARNTGLDNATGKYLMFCDSDDGYKETMCQTMFDTIESQNVDVVCCHNFFNYEDGLDNYEKYRRTLNWYFNPKTSGRHKLTDKRIVDTNVLLWNKIWKRELVTKHGIRFPTGHEHDDDTFWYQYAFVSREIYFLRTPLYYYFLRSGSIMSSQIHKQPKNRYDRLAITDYILNFLQQHNLLKQHKQAMLDIFHLQLKGIINFFTLPERIEICHQMNDKIHNILHLDAHIVCYMDGGSLALRRKGFLKLLTQTVYYNLLHVYYRIIRDGIKTKEYHDFALTNLYEWKYKFHRRGKPFNVLVKAPKNKNP
ncbi:MAG: glycosyltransferase [Alphaproteobacteria bacterium]|nr:glycosyltransferase [Alphaproteobacteria bacterium]